MACLENCIKELYGIDVPQYNDDGDWLEKLNNFMVQEHHKFLLPIAFNKSVTSCRPEQLLGKIIEVYTNPNGKTPQEKTHAVIGNGKEIIYDPSDGHWFKIADGKHVLDYYLIFCTYREDN